MATLKYEALGSLQDFHNSPCDVKVLCGPVGSGKTSAALWEFIFLCLESAIPLRGIILRSSYRELRDSTRATFLEWFGAIATYMERDEKAIITLPGKGGGELKHELMFRACQREEEASKFLSTEFAFAFLEEVVPAFQQNGVMGGGLPEGVLNVVLMRMRQKGAHRRPVVLTFNPPTPRHWTYKRFFARSRESLEQGGTFFMQQKPRENEKNLPLGYYDTLLENLPPDMARRFVMGEVVAVYDGVRVFPEAKDNHHIVDFVEPIPGVELVMGFDYGLTPATIITQITPAGQWRWLKELQSFNMGIDRHAEHLRALLYEEFQDFKFRCRGDPAGGHRAQTDEKTCVDVLSSHGFTVTPGKEDWQSRKEAIKQRLERTIDGSTPALVVSREGCPMAAEALLGGYRYPQRNSGEMGYRPLKNEFSHIMDAAQYVATVEFDILHKAPRPKPTSARALLPKWNPLASIGGGRRKGWMAK